ncbi:MAG: hypothetical protein ACN4GZ_19310 [Acidimicrobiales bacterium]
MALLLRLARRPIALLACAGLIVSACNGGTTVSSEPDELGFAGDETTTSTEVTTTVEPAMSDSEPVEDELLPVEDEQAPANDEQPPADNEQPPADDTQVPADDEQPPVDLEQLPVDDVVEDLNTNGLTDSEVELIAGLLETELGRQLFIEGMMEDSNLTIEQATCFVDAADVTTLLSFGQGTQSENAALVDLFSTLSECNIDINDFEG